MPRIITALALAVTIALSSVALADGPNLDPGTGSTPTWTPANAGGAYLVP